MEFERTTPERQLLAHAAQKRRPASGTLELSPLCNLNCDMCYVRLTPGGAGGAGAAAHGGGMAFTCGTDGARGRAVSSADRRRATALYRLPAAVRQAQADGLHPRREYQRHDD